MTKKKLRLVKSEPVWQMPDPESLAQMSQDQIKQLADQLPDRLQRLALVTKWSLLKSNRHHRAERQALAKRQQELAKAAASKAELARLRQDAMFVCADLHRAVTHNAQVLNHYAEDTRAQAGTLRQHKSRLDSHQQAIISLGRENQSLHRQAMNEIGAVVNAMCENGGQIEDERRHSHVRFDYLLRQAATLRESQQAEQLARQAAEYRVAELEGQMSGLKADFDRASRFILELPEMRLTRSLVLMGQALKETFLGAFGWRAVRVAGAAILLLTLAAGYSNHELKAAHAQTEPAVVQCAFYDGQTGDYGIQPMDAMFHGDRMYFLLNCGTTDEVRLYGTLQETLPKDGIFTASEVVKLPDQG